MKANWEETHKNVVRLLNEKLCPIPYRTLYPETVVLMPGNYSVSTDPVEKFRQHFSDSMYDDTVFIEGGLIGLRSWFPEKKQFSLLPPCPMILQGNCIFSYEAGFEQAKRQEYMYDHFGDASTVHRYERRRRGALVEKHVKEFFKSTYPEFYKPPSNEGQYKTPAKEDFYLRTLTKMLPIDVKSWSYQDDESYNVGVARDPSYAVVYLWADWHDDETVAIYGICDGGWLRTVGEKRGPLVHMLDRNIFPVESLLVVLNMARAGQNYDWYRRIIK